MVGGNDGIVQNAAERRESEKGCYLYCNDRDFHFRPQVHLTLKSSFMIDTVSRLPAIYNATNIAGITTDAVNDLPYEVPNTIDFTKNFNNGRLFFAENGSLTLNPLQIINDLAPRGYLYTHLKLPFGCTDGANAVTTLKDSFHMPTRANWPYYIHAGQRDQSIVSAKRFYTEIILDNNIFRRGVQK
jgi:hypothetical protein